MRVGFDIDGCLANFNHAYGDLMIKLTGRDNLPKRWKTDPDFPEVWDWDVKYGYKEDLKGIWDFIKDPKNEFWVNLPFLTDTKVLSKIYKLPVYGHDVYFITNRPGNGAKTQTEAWLDYNGLALNPTVLIAENKPPIIKSLNLDFYVDDRLQTMIDLENFYYKSGIDTKDKHFYLLDAPYNRTERPSTVRVISSLKEGLERAGLWTL